MKWQLHLKWSIYIELTLTIFYGFIILGVETKHTNSSCIEKQDNT